MSPQTPGPVPVWTTLDSGRTTEGPHTCRKGSVLSFVPVEEEEGPVLDFRDKHTDSLNDTPGVTEVTPE